MRTPDRHLGRGHGRDSLDRRIAAGAVERFARQRCHQLDPRETGLTRRCLAAVQHHAPDAAPDMERIGIHRADAGRLAHRIERPGIAQRAMRIAAVQRRTKAPPAAADEGAVIRDNEIGAIRDQLSVEAHRRAAGGDLLG